tara:strand:- start:146 stop:412 length:267 start_codon:yes stop_codon:yes gene_type:complete
MIDWTDEVKQYKEQERDGYTQSVEEWVESLVPVYYVDLIGEYVRLCLMNELIPKSYVGIEIWKFMQSKIFDQYLELFYNELHVQNEEE